MRKKYILIIILVIFIFPNINPYNFDFEGYYKTYYSYIPISQFSNKTESNVSQKIRFDLENDLSKSINLNLSYEFITSIKSQYFIDSKLNKEFYRIDDSSRRLYPYKKKKVGNWLIEGDLDRLYAEVSFPFGDLYVGRQAISWGSSHIINPTDIFLTYSFSRLDKEEKTGVDAVRIRLPFGMMSEVDVGAVFGKDFKNKNNAYFSRFKFYINKTDFYFLGMFFKNNMLYGFNMTRPLGGAGTWLELSYVENDVFDNNKFHNYEDGYFRLSAGFDYYFSSNNYFIVEYHLNSTGENNPEEYENLAKKNSYREGNVYLLGKNYICFVHSYQFSGLLQNTNSVIYNLNDGSISINPSLEYNIAENIYLAGGMYIYSDIINQKKATEFESYDDLLYTSFRVYF